MPPQKRARSPARASCGEGAEGSPLLWAVLPWMRKRTPATKRTREQEKIKPLFVHCRTRWYIGRHRKQRMARLKYAKVSIGNAIGIGKGESDAAHACCDCLFGWPAGRYDDSGHHAAFAASRPAGRLVLAAPRRVPDSNAGQCHQSGHGHQLGHAWDRQQLDL